MSKDHKNPSHPNAPSCSCCGPGAAISPPDAASNHRYKAMVLSCIDPRMQKPVYEYLDEKVGAGNYSHLAIAGAAIAAVAPSFEHWHPTVWDNIAVSLKFHKFPKVIVVQHRQCGAAGEAYGYVEAGSKEEKRLHRSVARAFRRELHKRHPQLEVEAVLMDLDGNPKKLL